jgi:hypothetical protein
MVQLAGPVNVTAEIKVELRESFGTDGLRLFGDLHRFLRRWAWPVCRGTPLHSIAMVVNGSSGAFSGSPVNLTRNLSCSNFRSLPVVSSLADFTLFMRPPSATVSPGQKCA